MNVKRFNMLLGKDLPSCALPVDRNVTPGEIDDSIRKITTSVVNALDKTVQKIVVR